jgi:hypothetical protein
MKNIGIDADLWKGLLGFSFDIFRRDRDGLLANPVTKAPFTFGTGFSQANLNADRTLGFEFELRHHNRINSDLSYQATGFISMTQSMITKKNQVRHSNSYDYWRNNTVNRYSDIWFGYGSNGVYKSRDQMANSIYAGIGETLNNMTAVTDRLSAYFALNFLSHQICLAHILLELNYLSEIDTGQQWSKEVADLLKEAMALRKENPKTQIDTFP